MDQIIWKWNWTNMLRYGHFSLLTITDSLFNVWTQIGATSCYALYLQLVAKIFRSRSIIGSYYSTSWYYRTSTWHVGTCSSSHIRFHMEKVIALFHNIRKSWLSLVSHCTYMKKRFHASLRTCLFGILRFREFIRRSNVTCNVSDDTLHR